jgi:tetratricopeptide (TPR) repeat protein
MKERLQTSQHYAFDPMRKQLIILVLSLLIALAVVLGGKFLGQSETLPVAEEPVAEAAPATEASTAEESSPRMLNLALDANQVDRFRYGTRPVWMMSENLNFASPEEISDYASYRLEMEAMRFQQEGKPEEAERLYRRAIQIFPERATLYNNLGAILFKQERYAEAEKAFTQALRLQSDNPQILGNLASAMAEQGKRLAAIALMRQAILRRPSNGQIHFNLASLLAANGDREEALTELETAVDLGAAIDIRENLDDTELDTIRNTARFKAVVERIRRELQ